MRKNTYLLLSLCSSFIFIKSQEYAVDKIAPELIKDANSVIRKDFTKIKINNISSMEIQNDEVITILNKADEEKAIAVMHYSKESKISDVEINIFDKTGKKIKSFGKSDCKDIAASQSFALYTDNRALYFQYFSNDFPFTIEKKYTESTSSTVFLQDYYPFTSLNTSLENSQLTIENKSGINLRTKDYPSTLLAVAKQEKSDNGTITYSYHNIPAYKEEIKAPNLVTLMPKTSFSLEEFSLVGKEGSLRDWDSFGKWYYEKLLMPVSIVTPELKQEVENLHLSGTIEEKVKKLYQYMQGKTRYVAVMMGIGGWQPMLVSDVDKKGYGDCKALSNYMRTLLDIAGIKSYYSVIYSDETPITFDKDFPKMFGNHVILCVPTEKDTIWLENTSQNIAYNHLSSSTTSRNVMAITDNGIKIIDTPNYSAEQSKEKLEAILKIGEDKSLSGKSKFTYYGGQYDHASSLISRSQKEREDYLKESFENLNFDEIKIENFNNDKDNVAISFEMDAKISNYCKKLGEDLMFRIVPFQKLQTLTEESERKLPFENPFAYSDDFIFKYELPVGYKPTELPKPFLINSEFGDYSLVVEKTDDNHLVVKRKINIKKGLYPKEKFQDYMNFRKRIVNVENTKMLISKK